MIKKQNYPTNFQKTSKKSWETPKTPTRNVQFKSITVRGDSHARHIAGLVRKQLGPATAVSDVCVPGGRFLDIVRSARTASDPRPCCEVLIAGTNDLAVGGQRSIYRHLEGYIAAGSSSTEIILTTLPHRHDLDPSHPVHYQTVLVNAYIEELAVRHNIRVLNFDDISRRYFTRHGQHLSWRCKRLLAGMIVAAMSPATQESEMKAQPRLWGNPRAAAASTSSMPTPAAARRESATTPQRPASIQDVSYADAVRRSPSPDILQIKGPTLQQRTKLTDQNRQNQTNQKLHVQGSLRLLHQNAQYATNKLDEIQLMCEELKSDILVVTENGFNNDNLELCKIPNYNLAEAYCRRTSKGGGVAIFLRQNLVFTKFTIKETTAKDFEAVGIKVQN
ncbi:hypothetical protein J6590_076402 [Homalodisca vitripennis]|nr:hypothetical protein J6590_076402 [Homalodisca vitripennis]